MRRLLLLVFAVLVTLPVRAAEITRPATVTPVGAPHSCDGFYPEAARLAHVEGDTALSFHIDANGAVRQVTIAKSSGNSDLDEAAMSCVRTWRYAPTLKDDKPIEVAWSAAVAWRDHQAPPTLPPMPVVIERDADCFHYPFWAERVKADGTATVSLTVLADGHPADIALSKPNGNDDLNKATLQCAQSLRFRVPDNASHAVTATATYTRLGTTRLVSWQFTGAFSSEAGQALTEPPPAVIQCLKGAAGNSHFTSGYGGLTIVWTTYKRGILDTASVLMTSGNDALDHYAVDCFKNQPPDSDRAHLLRYVGNAAFPILWSRYLGL